MKCKVEIFSRVTGFFRPIQGWNPGKTKEFKDRKKFDTGLYSNSGLKLKEEQNNG